MSRDSRERYLDEIQSSLPETKGESLLMQHQLLVMLCGRHRLWANDTANPDIERLHWEIINIFLEALEKYHLLESCDEGG
jgi:hypothetical protein